MHEITNVSDDDIDIDIDWDTEDDLEIENYPLSSCSSPVLRPSGVEIVGPTEVRSSVGSSGSKILDHFLGMGFSEEMAAKAIQEHGEGNTDLILETLLTDDARNSSLESSNSKVLDHFVGMGFSKEIVSKAIQENGEGNTDLILEALLTYSAIEMPPQEINIYDSDESSSEIGRNTHEDFSDINSRSAAAEEIRVPVVSDDRSKKLLCLGRMGYTIEEAQTALERCGSESTIAELTDFISASHIAMSNDALIQEHDEIEPKPEPFDNSNPKKRKVPNYQKKEPIDEKNDCDVIRLPNPMIGFGVPSGFQLTNRDLPRLAIGPPYFYYENVALAPKGVWDTISRYLYDVEPEFVDSKYFCATARKRGYIHNLPIQNRFTLSPRPPQTIHEAFPLTKKWWPSWDPRVKLNCIQTVTASGKTTERVRKALEMHVGVPPLNVQKYVLTECRKWNLVWVGKHKVAPLEPDEMEMLLGFPRNHTRGGGINRTERFRSLGNSFQLDTVAYHLSVLKDMFPEGINLLSLFSGIGGAEVVLHRLGIPLRNVVTVEISELNRGIMRSWWQQTNQTGTLTDLADVQQLNADRLRHFMNSFGGFDLVVGGSPCNNLAGSNRYTRDGLEGEKSSLFYDYFRILDLVKCVATRKRQE